MHKNENVGKHRPNKVAQSSSPKKINQPQPYEAQLVIRGIEPLEEERCAPYLSGLFQINRADLTEEADDDDFVGPPVRLQKTLNPDPFATCNESKNANNTTSKLKEDERNNFNEKLNKIMSDIRLRQDQIIAQQIDLKYEVRAIRRSVDDKIAVFLEELKAKLDGKCSSDVSPGQIVLYKSLNTGFGDGIGDQQNISNPLDDKFYTEDVMEQVEEIFKSAEKSKHSGTTETNIEVVLNGYCGSGAFKYSKLVELAPSNVHHRRYYTLSLNNFNTKVYSIATTTVFE
ncbi:Uncharacterized protein Fot_21218 [Forsythia ovata]|uniref:Uncharacterized protein n=1 Tax=Forsythia ovata TaxID=205694 RepID=A0ABD1UUD4_9LAMI